MKDLVEVFKDTLEIANKYKVEEAIYYPKNYSFRNFRIIWSNNTVKSIFEVDRREHIAALNFADDEIPGGLVWQGANTQEECLCRCSNLYSSLLLCENSYYREEGGLIYSKDVIFFKDSDYNIVDEPRRCDIISCAALGKNEEIKQKMKLILYAAQNYEVDALILGKWGCGALGRNWNEMKGLWKEVLIEVNFI